ncbi:hypothetical protein KIN20_029253 [Parelaphostrongylus tenuis]|uniref:Uncharacterized protein n=1 Tax=Parelaphostrongylus tenuis TaxID=148309 RepID=A0AAD5R236_PARTN|nr:hypothetical protein KIN20_029253 [Parelaphostrongylus tenuis]
MISVPTSNVQSSCSHHTNDKNGSYIAPPSQCELQTVVSSLPEHFTDHNITTIEGKDVNILFNFDFVQTKCFNIRIYVRFSQNQLCYKNFVVANSAMTK